MTETQTATPQVNEPLAPGLARPETQQEPVVTQEATVEQGPVKKPGKPEVSRAVEEAGQVGAGRVVKAIEALKTAACVVAGTPELIGSGTRWLKTAMEYSGAWIETRPQVIGAIGKEMRAQIQETRAEKLDVKEKGLEKKARAAEKPFWKEFFDFVRRQTERQAKFLRQEALTRREAAQTIRQTVNQAVEGGAKLVEIPEGLEAAAGKKERRPLAILSKKERREAKALRKAERQQQAEAKYLERKRQNAAKLGLLSRNRDKSRYSDLREFRQTEEYRQLKEQLQYELRGFGIALGVISETETQP